MSSPKYKVMAPKPLTGIPSRSKSPGWEAAWALTKMNRSAETSCSMNLPPTPLTGDFRQEQTAQDEAVADTNCSISFPTGTIHTESDESKIHPDEDAPVVRRRRIILNTSPKRSDQASHQDEQKEIPSIPANVSENTIALRSGKSLRSPRKKIIFKTKTLPRNLHDQVDDTLIKAHQAINRADEIIEEHRARRNRLRKRQRS